MDYTFTTTEPFICDILIVGGGGASDYCKKEDPGRETCPDTGKISVSNQGCLPCATPKPNTGSSPVLRLKSLPMTLRP